MKVQTINIKGKIIFDPPNVTEKHRKQGEWKKVAILSIGSDLEKYYGWFIKKRYDIGLATTLRGPYVTFINDKLNDMEGSNEKEREKLWNSVKKKWHGKSVQIELEVSPYTDSEYWWLRVYPESRKPLEDIRKELGLGRPYFGMHMTIGSPIDKYESEIEIPNEKKVKKMNVEQAKYIHRLLEKKLIN